MTPSRPLLATLCVVAVAALLAACGDGAGDTTAHGGPTVVATTTQLGDLTRAVAGTRAGVRQILEPNSDPHAYEPRPSDVRALSGAKLVVRSGGDLDGWLGDVLRNAGSDAHTITILDGLRARRDADGVDPHWWQDPRNAVIAVRAHPRRARCRRSGRARRLRCERRALRRPAAAAGQRDRRLHARASPRRERRLVTDHDALGYYADRYAIEVIGTVIPALSTQAQASAGEVAQLVRTIRSTGVSTIFPESSVNPKLTRAIARERTRRSDPRSTPTRSGRRGRGATYLGSLRSNTRALVRGFTAGREDCVLPG